MMDLENVDGLINALPDWFPRLQVLTRRFHDHGLSVEPVNPSPQPERPVKRLVPSNLLPGAAGARKPLPAQEVGSKKLNARPTPSRAKFSSITGPEINYDGESQKILFDCWTALNTHRGSLRKQMMQMKRKKVLTLPTAGYGYEDSDEDLEADDDDNEETPEEKMRREEEERKQREEQKRKEEEEKKKSALLEDVDGYLDKASKACESAAFLWLKGEGCTGHVVYIQEQIRGAIGRIRLENLRNAPELEPPKVDNDDEGFSEVDDGVADLSSEEELPHKKACQRPSPEPDPAGLPAGIPANPPEVSGTA